MRLEKGVVVAAFVGLGALVVHGCAGDLLVLPVFDDAGAPVTSDASCTQCGDECVDPKTDPRHCGTCANACAGGSACVAGACSLTCPTGLVNCAGTCLDPTTSDEHCGATSTCDGASAGTKCATGQSCAHGVCASPGACPATTPDACGTGAAALCTSFKSDPNHCGDCATVCDGGVCNNGTCGVACGPLQTTCGTGGAATCHTPTAPNDCCGTLCAADKDCTTAGCVACIPTTVTLSKFPVAPDPALKVACQDAAGNPSTTCPVVKCGGITFFAFSYFDNRISLGVVGYDTNGAVIKPNVEKSGVRYISSITVNASTVSLVGQDGLSVDMPFSAFRLP
ncbi:MAG: Tryptophan synthase alpha chain [Myxococcaceae bacterium]|nr:Tryptophan synthase alpha chain [Myxococcaceae bacterium]